MSHDIYGLCCRYQGKVVKINEHNGRVHYGRITRVSRNNVYLEPIGSRGGLGGYGYWGYGYGYGYGYGGGYRVALGVIAGVALAGLFFW
ncbi:hypothetical protein [Bacillus pinisoli]|uniref:hypothetical protein n=1 Tax=Bacillus pinisoli TaxID=2901866 RepID=UPI001FF5D84D|nr:hypothetical protein [Bacillus pinisoli]